MQADASNQQEYICCQVSGQVQQQNIARGTTDPEIDSVTWIEFSNNMAPLANLPTRWRQLH